MLKVANAMGKNKEEQESKGPWQGQERDAILNTVVRVSPEGDIWAMP